MKWGLAKSPVIATERPPPPERLWVLRWHNRVSLRQAHAVVRVDWLDRVARTACGLALSPEEIADIPALGCAPCEMCVAATPRPISAVP
ncbi:hypothetical protein [Saccharopolyspora gloriosae]|uniref:hypothetical protein n=1 Tax=Saccharopolyspora gloriosae TaxID=455344 RepID=UPI001FB7FB7F|nr:hypothetical protein [Saccharopolyspora gloriosae]